MTRMCTIAPLVWMCGTCTSMVCVQVYVCVQAYVRCMYMYVRCCQGLSCRVIVHVLIAYCMYTHPHTYAHTPIHMHTHPYICTHNTQGVWCVAAGHVAWCFPLWYATVGFLCTYTCHCSYIHMLCIHTMLCMSTYCINKEQGKCLPLLPCLRTLTASSTCKYTLHTCTHTHALTHMHKHTCTHTHAHLKKEKRKKLPPPPDHTKNPDPNTFEAQYEVWQQEMTEKWYESPFLGDRPTRV